VQTAPITATANHGKAVAGLFPGQGSHTSEMRERTARHAPQLLRRCIELVGEDPFPRVTESTRFAQPAIYCASIASLTAHRASGREGAVPIAYAGHSLGELAALVAAGVIGREDGLRLAVERGRLMAEAGEGDGTGGMLALLGASPEQCERLAQCHHVVVANENAPGQTVLAGPVGSVRAASAAARGEGLRAIMLDVAAAFHSPAMAAAVAPFRELLEQVEVSPGATPVVSCASGKPFLDVKDELAQAIVKPVRWSATMAALSQLGAHVFLDFGPGKVLARLVARNVPGAETIEPGRAGSEDGSASDSHDSGESRAQQERAGHAA